MTTDVHVPIVAAPQDAHGEAEPLAAADVARWQDLPQVHKHGVGQGIRVGVVDTGMESNSWFSGQVHGDQIGGNVSGLLAQNYKAGHATFVAGLVLQQAPAATVQIRRALDWNGEGTIDDVVDAALDLVQGRNGQPVDVLNLSLGSYEPAAEATFRDLFTEVLRLNQNLVVVAAAGNLEGGAAREFYPAALADHTNIVSVGAATDRSAATLAAWCNTGPWLTFLTDGTDLISTYLRFPTTVPPHQPGRWVRWGGSSFATAATSGLIAGAMAPGDGTSRLGPDAVRLLVAGRHRPVSLPTTAFPPP
jgi:membrane-anchored mycosin MYCP